MIKVSVLYPNMPGGHFDLEYYRTRHMPMVLQRCGSAAKLDAIERGLAEAPFCVAMHLLFENLEAMNDSLNPHVPEFLADLPNFTNIQPTLQVAEVVS